MADPNESSNSSLSPPPRSPEHVGLSSKKGGVAAATATSTPPPGNATSTTPRLTASGQIRKKPGPKPKPKDPNAPEKRTRKPRKTAEPKDPTTEPTTRRRRTKASLEAQAAVPPAPEEKIPMQHPTPQHASPTPQTRPADVAPVPQPEQHGLGQGVVAHAPRLSNNPDPMHNNPTLSHITTAPTTPRPASSGQRYDPIRGGLIESKPQSAAPAPISPPLNRASGSPAITSLIDPQPAAENPYSQASRMQQQMSVTSAPVSPIAQHPSRPSSLLPSQEPQHAPRAIHAAPSMAMEIDSDNSAAPRPGATSVPMKKTNSASAGTPSHSNAPTPPVKPARQKEAPPPMPTGSGLLSGTPFGPAAASSTGSTESQGTNIWLTIPLRDPTNTINFAQEVEKRYGFAALHPKIAARKERLRQVTAAGAALERANGLGSNDDMSLDLSEPESNVEMGGMEEDSAAPTNGVKKRRKRKQEDYDKEDDFIDDTELAWEQKALMAKDGFFVYSGLLVAENEKPVVERSVIKFHVPFHVLTTIRADGTVKRGRGRGRGGSTRGETTGRGRGRGGGPGSRGGQTVRKPRVTKADRAAMEQEKLEREKMAATIAAKQPLAYSTPM